MKKAGTQVLILAGILFGVASANAETPDIDWPKIELPMTGDPLSPTPDSDGDGMSDELEMSIGTDHNSADSDGDGFPDLIEIMIGDDPLAEEPCARGQTPIHSGGEIVGCDDVPPPP